MDGLYPQSFTSVTKATNKTKITLSVKSTMVTGKVKHKGKVGKVNTKEALFVFGALLCYLCLCLWWV